MLLDLATLRQFLDLSPEPANKLVLGPKTAAKSCERKLQRDESVEPLVVAVKQLQHFLVERDAGEELCKECHTPVL